VLFCRGGFRLTCGGEIEGVMQEGESTLRRWVFAVAVAVGSRGGAGRKC
jgi:hypothetical protein